MHVHADTCYHFALTDNNKKVDLIEKNCKETGKVVYKQPGEGMLSTISYRYNCINIIQYYRSYIWCLDRRVDLSSMLCGPTSSCCNGGIALFEHICMHGRVRKAT